MIDEKEIERLIQFGNYDAAEKKLEDELRVNPDNTRCLRLKAHVCELRHYPEEAQRCCAAAVRGTVWPMSSTRSRVTAPTFPSLTIVTLTRFSGTTSTVCLVRFGADGMRDLDLFLSKADVERVPVDAEQAHPARLAHRIGSMVETGKSM